MQYSGNITSSYGCEGMYQPRRFYPLRAKLYALREGILSRRYDTHTLTEEAYRKLDEKIDRFYVDGFGQFLSRNVLSIVDAHARKCVDCKIYIGNVPQTGAITATTVIADYYCAECRDRAIVRSHEWRIKRQKKLIRKAKKHLGMLRLKLKELQAY